LGVSLSEKERAGFTFQSSPIKIGEGFPLQSLTQNLQMKRILYTMKEEKEITLDNYFVQIE